MNTGSQDQGTSTPNFWGGLTPWITLGLLIGILVVVLFTIFVPTESDRTNDTVTIGYSPLIINLPVMVAAQRNIFEDHNVSVEFSRMPSTNTMRDAVSSGEIDIAAALGTEMFIQNNNLNEGNIHGLYFNVLTTYRYVDAIITTKASEINGIYDLNGKNIGTYPSSTTQAYLNIISDSLDIDYDISTVGPNESLQLLSSGRIDALLALEPVLTQALTSNEYKLVESAPIAKRVASNFPVGIYAVNGSFLQRNKQLVSRVQTAMNEATSYIEDNQNQAIRLGERFLGASKGEYSQVHLPIWTSGCDITNNSLRSFARTMERYKVVATTRTFSEFIFCGNNAP